MEESFQPEIPTVDQRVKANQMLRNGDSSISLNRSQGATITMLIAAGLSLFFVAGVFIFNIIAVIIVFRPIAIFLQLFWIWHFVETGVAFASGTAAGYGKVVQRVILWDILGAVFSVLGLLSVWAGFGISVVFYWRCVTNTGSLTQAEQLMCDDEWILGTVWWTNVIGGTLLAVLTFVAHIYSFATTQIPNVFGIFSTGSFLITGKATGRRRFQGSSTRV